MKINLINSKGFWEFGWVRHPEAQARIINALGKAGVKVSTYEVDSLKALNQLMDKLNPADLVWTNAYHIYENGEGSNTLWFNEQMETKGFKIVGSSSRTLSNVLQKDHCQKILKDQNITIPPYLSLSEEDIPILEQLVLEQGISFPAIVKPSATAGSMGIHLVNAIPEAQNAAQKVITAHGAKAIMEPFLQGPDITVGILYSGDRYFFLPTYYEKLGVSPDQNYVMERSVRLAPWTNRRLRLVIDENILKVIYKTVPAAYKALGIRDITRIDGRLNAKGEFCIFDVNGLPGLGGPEGVTAKQSWTVFPQLSEDASFELLIYSIVYCAAKRSGVEVTPRIEEFNFFNQKA